MNLNRRAQLCTEWLAAHRPRFPAATDLAQNHRATSTADARPSACTACRGNSPYAARHGARTGRSGGLDIRHGMHPVGGEDLPLFSGMAATASSSRSPSSSPPRWISRYSDVRQTKSPASERSEAPHVRLIIRSEWQDSTITHRRRCLHRPEPIYICRLRSMAQLHAKDKDSAGDDGHAVGHVPVAAG